MVVNFGPQADGDFRPEEKALATAIGKWMSRYGKAVYACDYAGFDKQDWGYQNPGEPYVIQLKVRAAKGTKGIYRDALT